MASSGPWILSMTLLIGIQYTVIPHLSREDSSRLMCILIYCFAFSLIWPAGLINMSVRCLADLLYANKTGKVSELAFSSMMLILAGSFLLSSLFFQGAASGPGTTEAIGLFCVMSCLWLIMSFSSTLSSYGLATASYAFGLLVSMT